MLKPINIHCAELCRILNQVDEFSWHEVTEWLHVASSVKRVEVDTVQHDQSFGWCANADHYQTSREKLLVSFVTRLSVFSFVWGALESALNLISVPSHQDRSKRGKISDACRFITASYSNFMLISPYHEEVTAFRSAIRRCSGYEKVDSRFGASIDIGAPGIGLYAVYKVRNLFAHGGITFPEPDEEHRPLSSHEALLTHATRIVLLSLQMLFLAHFRNSSETIEYTWHNNFQYEAVDLPLLFRTFHFTRCYNQEQYELPNLSAL